MGAPTGMNLTKEILGAFQDGDNVVN